MKTKLFTIICTMLALLMLTLSIVGCDMIPGFGGDDNGDVDPSTCEHKFGEWQLYKDGSCDERIYVQKCTACGKEAWKFGNDESHTWTNVEKKATCISDGKIDKTCSVCGATDSENIPATGVHTPEESISTNNDYHWYTCKDCGASVDRARHEFIDNVCTVCDRFNFADVYYLTVWVSELDGAYELYNEQIEEFKKLYPDIELNIYVSGVPEGAAGSYVYTDVVSAPDIYCITQDQLHRLVSASAVSPVQNYDKVISANDPGSIQAATVGEVLYAYPISNDAGCLMYYDKSLFTEEDLESMERIIEICEENGRTFCFPVDYNGWYTASFFFATGCESTWITDENGDFIDVNDTFNSDAGIIAMKGMRKLTQSSCYSGDNEYNLENAAVVISGIWAADQMKDILGENYAATDLPSFEVDGKSYHLGSFSGNKLMAVKPQYDEGRSLILHHLAEYLTGEECQTERLERLEWGPSNLKAQQSEYVKSSVALAALAKQSEYATLWGHIPNYWWPIVSLLGRYSEYCYTDEEIIYELEYYEEQIHYIISYYN